MEKVGAYEAKTHLSKLLERVQKGETITITRHGVPIAILAPPDKTRRVDPKIAISEIKRFRDAHSLDGLNVKEMIEEGRR